MKPVANFEEAEFEALYLRLAPKLVAFAYKWSANQELAEDLVQEAFATVWNKRYEVELNPSIESFLYTILRNSLITDYQRKLKERDVTSNLKIVNDNAADEHLTAETFQKIEQYIEELPPRCKEVFLMSKRDGLTYQEIATELSLSIKSVEKHISKALKILRKRLGQAYFFFF